MTDRPRPQAELVRIRDLQPAEWNPRTIDKDRFENLRKAIRDDPEFLWHRPILAVKDGTIYAGNMRYRAAEKEGLKEVPAIVEDITLEQAKVRALRDNGQWGEWQEQQLAELIASIPEVQRDTLGFDPGELERLLAVVGLAEETSDDDFDPTPPSEPITRRGDRIQLGTHILVCGDARDAAAWDALLAGDLADSMWTDPPYGVDLAGITAKRKGAMRGFEGSSMDTPMEGDAPNDDTALLLREAFAVADQHLKPGAVYYIAGPTNPAMRAFLDAIDAAGWHFSQTLIWVKQAFVPGPADYHYQHEALFYGWKLGAAHRWNEHHDESTVQDEEPELGKMDRVKLLALVKELRNARRTDVVREDRTLHNDLHPTMKPPRLIRTTLGNSTVRGAIVVDPFAGSGSTMVACHQMGRRARLLEIEPKYCDVIIRRYRELTGDEPVVT